MPTPLVQVDAFTDRPFSGNPAAVCLMGGPAAESWMQAVAGEMNLPETAFVYRSGGGWDLRWFTPMAEVDLCGHATLASAHALWETQWLPLATQARFQTRSGLLTADYRNGAIEMDFPAIPAEPVEPPSGLVESLGKEPTAVWDAKDGYVVEYASDADVRVLSPDLRLVLQLPRNFVVATALSDWEAYDIVSRVFAPRVGIDEDPVTGSAHCILGPLWAKRLDKEQLVAYQASARGGALRVHVSGNRVKLIGQAVTVLRGELV